MNERESVINTALGEVGYLEKKSNAQLDNKTANAGNKNYTKYAKYLDDLKDFYNGNKNGYAWCDVFVDWCFVHTFGEERALELLCQPKKSCGAGVGFSADYYKAKGQFYTTPEKGDQIFFKDNKGTRIHTGLVYNVDVTYVYTVEGNTSTTNGDGVAKKKYKLTSTNIYGYGRPKYKIEVPKKSIEEIAKEVIAGKWGNGDDRKNKLTNAGYNYSEVQAKVNVLLKPATQPATQVKITSKNFTARSYKFIKSKYTRTTPIVGDNKIKYKNFVRSTQAKLIKDSLGYAKVKIGESFYLSKFQDDYKGNVWGMYKGTKSNIWMCVYDSTGYQVK